MMCLQYHTISRLTIYDKNLDRLLKLAKCTQVICPKTPMVFLTEIGKKLGNKKRAILNWKPIGQADARLKF